jgi:hypothetical protein
MADNFNLRSFLSENKLTKNAQLLNEVSFNGKPVNVGSIEIDGIDMEDYPDFVDAYIAAAEYEDGTPLSEDELLQFQEENYDLVSQMIHDDQLYLEGEVENDEEQANDIEQAQHDMERRIDAQVEGALQESRLTAKERRLVEMVNNAMGIQEEEIPNPHPENPDHEFGTNALTGEPLPDPKSQMVVEDEMADETVIPEYNTIDELMNSIDHGTNKVAEEHKMQEMKKIAEALRMKAKKMEESEHAAHISPKDLKQLATDAAKLEKAAEKLKAAFDKKFNKKEKTAAAPKAEKVEALQEGFFDLRKFLVENKLTAGSRMLNELSPELLNRAADKAKSQGRTLQANKFSNAANQQTYKAAAIEKSAKMEPMKPFEGKEVNLYYDIKTNQGIKPAVTVPHKISNIEIDTNGAMAVYLTQTSNNSIATQKAFFFIPEADHYRMSSTGFTHDTFLIRGLDQAGAQLLWKLAKAFKPDTQVTPNTLVDGAPTPLAGKAFQPTPAQ